MKNVNPCKSTFENTQISLLDVHSIFLQINERRAAYFYCIIKAKYIAKDEMCDATNVEHCYCIC